MAQKVAEIEVPALGLKSCSVQEHCEALRRIKRLPFWWYQGTGRLLGNFALPFQDRHGNWWYQVKPGFCWAADIFRPIDPRKARPPYFKTFLGYQHVVSDESQANSHLVINAILDLSAYGVNCIDTKRRNAIRKGFKFCQLTVLETLDDETLEGCLAAWNDLSSRTGWKHPMGPKEFGESWRRLLEVNGATIIVGKDVESARVAGFLVTKIIGDTAYVDTIASCTELLKTNVNDAVMFAFLMNAKKIPGVTKAHYAIKSSVVTLENFKTGLGFVPNPFPARTVLRGAVGPMFRRFRPVQYDRMIGIFHEDKPQEGAPKSSALAASGQAQTQQGESEAKG